MWGTTFRQTCLYLLQRQGMQQLLLLGHPHHALSRVSPAGRRQMNTDRTFPLKRFVAWIACIASFLLLATTAEAGNLPWATTFCGLMWLAGAVVFKTR